MFCVDVVVGDFDYDFFFGCGGCVDGDCVLGCVFGRY